jgi:hypothetical protein
LRPRYAHLEKAGEEITIGISQHDVGPFQPSVAIPPAASIVTLGTKKVA